MHLHATSPLRPLAQFAAACGALLVSISGTVGAVEPAPGERLSFNRDVRPILSDKCFRCHGPDAAARQGDLRLDERDALVALRDGRPIIVPGRPEAGELVARIETHDAERRMPPPDAEVSLSSTERAVLRRWVAEGAEFEQHWALSPLRRPEVPPDPDDDDVRHPIDRFVSARLRSAGLAPAPEAEPAVLCRRLHLDLTGLPPTPAVVERFVRRYTAARSTTTAGDEPREAVYRALVDELLASPRYGEHMARPWLDAARYADTNGYQTDGPRHMWRWRDWVIEAFNRNLPFDRFTIEQLAGDLLPRPTLDQQIATGFNRNHRMNAEGGIIAEEFLAEYVADRVETTATVWLGLTIGCARCHDHKYDPISQRDFYRLFAFFNNVPEPGKAIRDDNSPPIVTAPTAEQQRTLEEMEGRIATARATWQAAEPAARRALAKWVSGATRNPDRWTITAGLTARYDFASRPTDEFDSATEIVAPSGLRSGGGPFAETAYLDGGEPIRVKKTIPFDSERPFSAAVWVKPAAGAMSSSIFAAMDPDSSNLGVELRLHDGRVELVLAARVLDDSLRVETTQALPADRWSHIAWTYGGVKSAEGVRIYLDGRRAAVRVVQDTLSNKFKATADLKIGGGELGPTLRGGLADLRFYDRALSADEAAIVFCGLSVRALAQQFPNFTDPAAELTLREYFLRHDGREPYGRTRDALRNLEAERDRFIAALPTVMVMRDVPGLRTTHLLRRGEYDKPGEAVTAGVPAALPPLDADAAAPTRLDLARWLVDARHPLTARVAVNRLWQQLFGTGLVKTTEDFGSQGEWPTHPELLDWLAVEFRDGPTASSQSSATAWDVKALLRTIVVSATYRQSSRASAELVARDPENRLLARGPRFRLSAEAVRDAALFASGLLKERVGGPSVRPYQPPGLWEELAAAKVEYEPSTGDDRYRRSLYTYRKRTVGPPGLMVFDAAGRETCVVRASRTNTPLQALNLLNDPAFIEAARSLARRMQREAGPSPEERIAFGFQCATARRPSAAELAILAAGHRRRQAEFAQHPERARALIATETAEPSETNAKMTSAESAERAAYVSTANVILNLDEFVTKE